MTHTNNTKKNEAGAIRLGGAGETLVASTRMPWLAESERERAVRLCNANPRIELKVGR